jgi:hypothetical protein
MERIKELREIKPSKLEFGLIRQFKAEDINVIEMAEIAVTADAEAELFEKDEEVYNHLIHEGISQHGKSKNRPKRFKVDILGVTKEKGKQYLIYAQSIHHDTNEVNIVRITPVNHITKYRVLTYLD